MGNIGEAMNNQHDQFLCAITCQHLINWNIYIPFLKSSKSPWVRGFYHRNQAWAECRISTIFHCWDGADQTWMPLPLSDWPISYFWLFYEHRTPSNSVVTHHISSLSPFRLLYIELGRYLYLYIYM